jgi:polar amino acid transport system substrate-binding protein
LKKLALAFLLLLSLSAHAQDKKPFRWGMDATGGAPYVFDNNTKGFEVDLAAYLAKELGRASEPTNGEWNKLPELLARGNLDCVLNGYEYSEQFRGQASIPYYIYRLTLVVNANSEIRSWDDLRARDDKPGKRVGVLTGSAAARYLEKAFGDSIRVQVFDDVANTYDLVATGQLDATVQDNPASAYYVKTDPEKRLRQIEESRGQGFYVLLTRIDDPAFREQLNAILRKGLDDGTLEAIYRKYGLWNDDQERLGFWKNKTWGEGELNAQQQETATTPIVWADALRLLLSAAAMTVLLAVGAMPIAMGVGLLVAIGRMYGPGWLKFVLATYVEILRGTPLLLQLWVLFYLLPRLFPIFGQVDPILIGIVGLALNYSASEAEHFRGGFQNLPRGQMEAALSLGLSPGAAIRRVVAPQVIRAAIPSVTNDFVALFKDTAVCSVIAVMELTKQYNTLYNNHRDQILVLAAITALLYLLMSYPLALLARWFEKRLATTKEGGRA